MGGSQISRALLSTLAAEADELGLMRLRAARLDDPGLDKVRRALDRFMAAGLAGDMAFLEQTSHLRKHPEHLLAGASTALVAVVPYAGEPGPIARYAQWHDYHTIVHRRLLALSRKLAEHLPDAKTLVCVDTKPVPERALAELAGVGSIGKNGCVIVPGLGSYVLLGLLLCTAELVTDDSLDPTHAPHDRDVDRSPQRGFSVCGSCTACLDACPTQAFDGPGELDPRRCVSYLTIESRGTVPDALAARVGPRIAGCDVCQEVCPHNKSPERSTRIPSQAWLPTPPGSERTPELLRLLDVGNSQHRSFVKHTPLTRIPRRSLRRNAALALAHVEINNNDIDRRLDQAARAPDNDNVLQQTAAWALAHRARGRQTK